MADIKFQCLSKQTLRCHGPCVHLHVLLAQRRISGQVKKDKMAREILSHLLINTTEDPAVDPSYVFVNYEASYPSIQVIGNVLCI